MIESKQNARSDTTNLLQNVDDFAENVANVVFRLHGAEAGAEAVEVDNPAENVEFAFAQVAPFLQSRTVAEEAARTLNIDDVYGVEERVTIEEIRTDLMKLVFKPELKGLGKKLDVFLGELGFARLDVVDASIDVTLRKKSLS